MLVDGHNDLAWALREHGEVDIAVPQPHLHTDLPRLRAGRVGAQAGANVLRVLRAADEATRTR